MTRPPRLVATHLRFSDDPLDEVANARLHAVARALLADPPPGLTDVVPGYATLMLERDASRLGARALDAAAARARVRAEADAPPGAEAAAGREVALPVRYDGADLAEVAARTGLEPAEVIRLHAGRAYRAFALGFLPGFPFLGPLDPALRLPRRADPRARVPAGAVAIAGRQTGVYPLASPGGWHLLGTLLEPLYDPRAADPFRVRPGDRVRFEPVDDPERSAPPEPEPLELLPAAPARPRLLVRRSGACDLVLDAGRFLAGRFGLARSGPADAASARLANALAGNGADAPLLEMTLTGPVLEALSTQLAAVAGWGLEPLVDGEPVEPFRSFVLERGSVLSFRPWPEGGAARSYLALCGGIEAAGFLGSASVDARARLGRPLRAGDALGAARERNARPRAFRPRRPWRRAPDDPAPLRLLPGPQRDRDALRALAERPWRVERADRAGLRLAPERGGAEVPGGDVPSEGAPLGALQVTADGRPLLLHVDRGTLGGYAKPAVLDPRDLDAAGRLREGARVRFVPPRGR